MITVCNNESRSKERGIAFNCAYLYGSGTRFNFKNNNKATADIEYNILIGKMFSNFFCLHYKSSFWAVLMGHSKAYANSIPPALVQFALRLEPVTHKYFPFDWRRRRIMNMKRINFPIKCSVTINIKHSSYFIKNGSHFMKNTSWNVKLHQPEDRDQFQIQHFLYLILLL